MKFIVRTNGRLWGFYDNPKGTLTDPFKQHQGTTINITDQRGVQWTMLKTSVIAWKECYA